MKPHLKIFLENFLAALRTCGALLLGNAVLLHFGVLGSNAYLSKFILSIGLALLAVSSVPWTSMFKFLRG
jgi:hypothetical protein